MAIISKTTLKRLRFSISGTQEVSKTSHLEPMQNIVVQWIELQGKRCGSRRRPLNIPGLWICVTPKMEACEYVGHPFYQGVNAIVITLLWGVAWNTILVTLSIDSVMVLLRNLWGRKHALRPKHNTSLIAPLFSPHYLRRQIKWVDIGRQGDQGRGETKLNCCKISLLKL